MKGNNMSSVLIADIPIYYIVGFDGSAPIWIEEPDLTTNSINKMLMVHLVDHNGLGHGVAFSDGGSRRLFVKDGPSAADPVVINSDDGTTLGAVSLDGFSAVPGSTSVADLKFEEYQDLIDAQTAGELDDEVHKIIQVRDVEWSPYDNAAGFANFKGLLLVAGEYQGDFEEENGSKIYINDTETDLPGGWVPMVPWNSKTLYYRLRDLMEHNQFLAKDFGELLVKMYDDHADFAEQMDALIDKRLEAQGLL